MKQQTWFERVIESLSIWIAEHLPMTLKRHVLNELLERVLREAGTDENEMPLIPYYAVTYEELYDQTVKQGN